MKEIILSILGIVIALTIARFLFENYITSRILCMVCCAAAIQQAIVAGMGSVWLCCVLCVLGWLFYRGAANFDFAYTGWVTYYSDGTKDEESEGGFFRHALAASVVMGLAFGFLVPQWNVLMFLIPGVILVLDVLSLGCLFRK